VSTLTPQQIQTERQRLMTLLRQCADASKVYEKNPAMMAVITGRIREIKDRLHRLERFGQVGG
jgi:hypothetical protein